MNFHRHFVYQSISWNRQRESLWHLTITSATLIVKLLTFPCFKYRSQQTGEKIVKNVLIRYPNVPNERLNYHHHHYLLIKHQTNTFFSKSYSNRSTTRPILSYHEIFEISFRFKEPRGQFTHFVVLFNVMYRNEHLFCNWESRGWLYHPPHSLSNRYKITIFCFCFLYEKKKL